MSNQDDAARAAREIAEKVLGAVKLAEKRTERRDMFTRSTTTVHSNGTATRWNVGDRIAEDDVQHSMEQEHNRLSRLAMDDSSHGLIESVTEAGTNIVVVYRDGSVTIHHWLREEQ